MCNFLSYIEKGDNFYYLDDSKVFSKEGRALLKHCQDNDILGHGTIRKYFSDTDGKPMTGGKNCEVNDFWNTEKLPSELATKVKNFEQHWGRMLKTGLFQNALLGMVMYAPEEYKALAWKQLLKQEPSNYDLRYLVMHAPEEYKALAGKQLLKQGPSNDDLRCLVEYAPEEYKALAWKQLLKQGPSNDDLRCLVEYAPEEYAKKAQKLLDER